MKHRRHRTSAYRRVALVIMLVVATTLIDPLGWIFSVQLGPVAHAAFTCPNTWPLRRAFIAYDGPTAVYSGSLLDSLASRFEFSTSINTHNIGPLKQRRPSFYAIRYNSLSDNYVPPNSDLDEYNWFVANAATYGADPEDAYLHFWVDTEVQLEGQNIVIPGWQPDSPKAGATATTRAEARVPVYYKNLVRRAVNFSTPEIRLAHRAYNISLMQEPITGSDYWGGWMFDNAAQTSLRVSIVTSGAYPNGGQLGEHPTHTVMNSSAFISWYWYEGMDRLRPSSNLALRNHGLLSAGSKKVSLLFHNHKGLISSVTVSNLYSLFLVILSNVDNKPINLFGV